jgi:hypothetical protein
VSFLTMTFAAGPTGEPYLRRSNVFHVGRLVLAVAAAGLALMACGASDVPGVATLAGNHANPSPSNHASAEQMRLQWAQCMRQHGVNVSDPNSSGDVSISGTSKSAAQAAFQACQRYQQGTQHGAPLNQAQMDNLVKFAQCMRQHGINVSDPQQSGGAVSMRLPDGVSKNSPQLQAAQHACEHYLPTPPPGAGSGTGGRRG